MAAVILRGARETVANTCKQKWTSRHVNFYFFTAKHYLKLKGGVLRVVKKKSRRRGLMNY